MVLVWKDILLTVLDVLEDLDGDGLQDTVDDDLDGDGILNGQDEDMDGDGLSNADETAAGSDPRNANSINHAPTALLRMETCSSVRTYPTILWLAG